MLQGTEAQAGAEVDSTTGRLMFLERLEIYKTQKPYSIHVPAEAVPNGLWSNEVAIGVDTPIKNMRGREASFDLDENGFEFIRRKFGLQYQDYADDSIVESVYLKSIEETLKDKLGASHTYVFDWKIRRRDSIFPNHPRGGDSKNPQPVQGVHVDFAPHTVVQLARQHLGSRASELLRGRCQIINVWHPLFGPLEDWPLAICDYRSIDIEQDLVLSDQIYPHRVEEIYNLYSNEKQEWYFLKDQLPEEILLFKIYDSNTRAARCAPHASFQYRDASANARLRESIESRVFIFHTSNSAKAQGYE